MLYSCSGQKGESAPSAVCISSNIRGDSASSHACTIPVWDNADVAVADVADVADVAVADVADVAVADVADVADVAVAAAADPFAYRCCDNAVLADDTADNGGELGGGGHV